MVLVRILAQRARSREPAEERESKLATGASHGVLTNWSTINDICLIFQAPAEGDLDSEGGVGRPLTPPTSSIGPEERDRSRGSSPTFPCRPTDTATPPSPPYPERRMPARSTAQKTTVGTRQPTSGIGTKPASSSRGSHDPPVPSAPTTSAARSHAGKSKKPSPSEGRRIGKTSFVVFYCYHCSSVYLSLLSSLVDLRARAAST